VVAGYASWHTLHDAARAVLRQGSRLIAHCALETLSVLTRLPPAQRSSPDAVVRFLDDFFDDEPLVLSATDQRNLPRRLVDLGIAGGAVYDGLVALTAATYGATLYTLDHRAERTYRRCGVDYRMVA
jgi:hypothetical protein